MLFAKLSWIPAVVLALGLPACNTQKTKLTPEEMVRQEEQKVLPKTLEVNPGSYHVAVECADATKTDKLKNLHWVVTLKSDGRYLQSQQNFDPNCEDACSAVEGGSVKVSEVQAVFTASQKLNIATNKFEAIPAPTAKAYFVMTYDRLFEKLTLIDSSADNVCQGKMILTLQK